MVFNFKNLNTEHTGVQKCNVLSDQLNYNMKKVIMEFLPDDTKNKLPAPALKCVKSCEGKNKDN